MTLDQLIDSLEDLRLKYGGECPVFFGDAQCGAYVRAIGNTTPARVAAQATEPVYRRGPRYHYLSSLRPGARTGVLSIVLED